MCRIILNKNNKPFNEKELRESYEQNPDGTGLYYYDYTINEECIKKFAKGSSFDDIGNEVKDLHKNKNIVNVNIHYRLGTSGGIGIDQTHPILMDNNIYMMHNGICTDFVGNTHEFSDTQCMAYGLNELLKQHKIKNINDIKQDKMLYCYICHKFEGSKVVLMQEDRVLIFNEDLGEGKDDIGRSGKEYTFTTYGYYTDGDKIKNYQITYKDERGIESKEIIYYTSSKNSAKNRFGIRHRGQNIKIMKVEEVILEEEKVPMTTC